MLGVPTRGNLTRTIPATVAANGTATADLSPTSSAALMIRQVSVEMDSAPAGATCSLRLNGVMVSPLIPTADVAVEPPPLFVSPGDDCAVVWRNCTPADQGVVFIIYDEVAQ